MPNRPQPYSRGTAAICVLVFILAVPQTITAQQRIRIATFNVSLHGNVHGEILDRLHDCDDAQARMIAAIVQIVRPDILLVNELDHDTDGKSAELLANNYFSVAQGNRRPVEFPYRFVPGSNTGLDSGRDLDGNQRTGEPNDAWGFGTFPGQYSMAIFSRFPIDLDRVRTFQNFHWSHLPNPCRPRDPVSGAFFHDETTWQSLKLSSKNHVDVPIRLDHSIIHLLGSHPTPPVFDGPEDRNGCRNHDEIRFWVDYLIGRSATHLVDDANRAGGIDSDALFVIAGDLNSDPTRGDSRRQAIERLLSDPRVQDPQPRHRGSFLNADEATIEESTADFGEIGRLRVDYVLPCRELVVKSSGVFWPTPEQDDNRLLSASDHRLVWVDIEIP